MLKIVVTGEVKTFFTLVVDLDLLQHFDCE